jgi:hypothetical protein
MVTENRNQHISREPEFVHSEFPVQIKKEQPKNPHYFIRCHSSPEPHKRTIFEKIEKEIGKTITLFEAKIETVIQFSKSHIK